MVSAHGLKRHLDEEALRELSASIQIGSMNFVDTFSGA